MAEKKERARAFKQRTAKTLAEELLLPGLFANNAVEAEHAFECIRDPSDAAIKIGDVARLVDMRDRIDVYIGVTCVGTVLSSHVTEMREIYALPTRPGRAILAEVIDVSDISVTFFVLIKK